MLDGAFTAALCLLAAVAAWSDLRHRRVSNRLCALIAVTGLARQAATLQLGSLALGLAGIAVGLAVLLPAFAARWVGGGDVKLLAALGAWLGPWGALVGGLLGVAMGGVLSGAMAAAGGAGREVAKNLGAAVVTMTAPVAPRRGKAMIVPLAVPLAAAGLLVYLGGMT
jgi:prepilin peptidase CpaA